MSYLSFVQRKIVMPLAIASLLSACGEELQVGDETGQEAAIASSTPFAYVSRDLQSQEQALLLNKSNAFNPGARLYVRESISSGANEIEIMAQYFAGVEYDVKDLNISSDGQFLVFSARSNAQGDSWNLYEYDFEAESVRRIIADSAQANSGNDTNPTYTNDGQIVFSSDRDSNIQSSALYSMARNGEQINQVPTQQGGQLRATTLKDGYMVVMRTNDGANTSNLTSGTPDLTNLLRIAPNGDNTKALFKELYINNAPADFSNIELADVIQGGDGHLYTIIKNKQNPLLGGQVVKLVGPKADEDSGAVYEFLNATALTGQAIQLLDNKVDTAGWSSSFWPYRDGTDRMLVSWSQCMKYVDGAYRFCGSNDNLDDVSARYGIWIFD